ncbi:membrane protein [Mesobacillus campisalis]|uniref:Membrane protein n=1 Tax=Mesobacillus campisalis TaxID=1408103 RepID=A0A0M2SVV5_9BACI|nr:CvpA family protein [Mesobacillus campisalis]KKK38303.1 membrane protein [Mesobacillus campisalis]
MLDLIVLLLLLIGFLVGLKRGFILQTIHMTGFIVAFIIAYTFYSQLAPKLVLWIPYPSFGSGNLKLFFDNPNIEDAYYRAIAFVAIFFAVRIVLQIIGSMFDFVASLPVLKSLNIWAGGILGFVEVYLIVFILLYIAALLPIPFIQEHLNDSFLASVIVSHTPILSEMVDQWWFESK